jgi:hypothetical protein
LNLQSDNLESPSSLLTIFDKPIRYDVENFVIFEV